MYEILLTDFFVNVAALDLKCYELLKHMQEFIGCAAQRMTNISDAKNPFTFPELRY